MTKFLGANHRVMSVLNEKRRRLKFIKPSPNGTTDLLAPRNRRTDEDALLRHQPTLKDASGGNQNPRGFCDDSVRTFHNYFFFIAQKQPAKFFANIHNRRAGKPMFV